MQMLLSGQRTSQQAFLLYQLHVSCQHSLPYDPPSHHYYIASPDLKVPILLYRANTDNTNISQRSAKYCGV